MQDALSVSTGIDGGICAERVVSSILFLSVASAVIRYAHPAGLRPASHEADFGIGVTLEGRDNHSPKGRLALSIYYSSPKVKRSRHHFISTTPKAKRNAC